MRRRVKVLKFRSNNIASSDGRELWNSWSVGAVSERADTESVQPGITHPSCPIAMPDCSIQGYLLPQRRPGASALLPPALLRQLQRCHVPHVRDCFVFFNLDAFNAKPIDK